MLPVCALMLSCASAPSSDVPDTSQAGSHPKVVLGPGLNAFTVCRGDEPESWFKESSAYDPGVIAHEAAHRKQMGQYPDGCRAFLRDPQARYDGEIEAFCHSSLARHRAGIQDLDDGLRRAAFDLWYAYDTGRSHTEITRDLRRKCGK